MKDEGEMSLVMSLSNGILSIKKKSVVLALERRKQYHRYPRDFKSCMTIACIMRVEIVVPLLWLTPTVSCHGAVTNYTIDGKVYPGRV